MRGTDSQVYCDNTDRLRLGLLVHVLDLCKWSRRLASVCWFFWVSMMCVYCLDRCTFKKQLSGRKDYGFHCYMEVCQFAYCLLSRTRVVSELPELNDWAAYMDASKIECFKKIDSSDFLLNYEFGEELQRGTTGELQEFRNRCREFMDRLVDVILECYVVASDFLQGVYSFCPELLLEGDDRYIFRLFGKLVQVLERSGALSHDDARTGTEEFVTFVVDVLSRHMDSGNGAESIADVVRDLLVDYSFLARRSLCRILRLCCLVLRRPAPHYPAVNFALNDCVVPACVVTSCLRGVQSYVCSPGFKMISLFTQHTMERVRDAISGARNFMLVGSDFDPWSRLCVGDRPAFIQRYTDLFEAHVYQKKKESYQRFGTANQRVGGSGSVASRGSAFSASTGSRPALDGSSSGGSKKTPPKRSLQQISKTASGLPPDTKDEKKKSKKRSGSAPSPRK